MPAMKWYTWALAADVYAVLRLAGVAGILPENDFFLVERLKENRIMTAMFVAAIVLIYVGILIPA